jgi:hypothetical protein
MRPFLLMSIAIAFCFAATIPAAAAGGRQAPAAPAPVRPTAPSAPAGGAPGPRTPGLPPRDPQATVSGTAILRGRITRLDTGAPLRRAQVRVFAPDLREPRSAMTDDDGRYELKELPAGRYSVNAMKGGYVSLQFGQRRAFEPGQPLELGDGQVLEKVDFALPRGGVISGRIVDEFGEPLTGVSVMAMRYRFVNGARRLGIAQGGGATDDRGEFRIFGLAPGDYYLNATLRMNFAPGVSDDHLGYAPTYYPGTPVSSEAQRVTVGLGEEISSITFPVVPARTATVSGLARDADGHPLSNAFITVIQRGDDGMPQFGGGGSTTRGDGSFRVSNLAPGSYILQARPISGQSAELATAEVVVNGVDIDGLALAIAKGSTARGRIRFDGTPGDLKPGDVRVIATPADGGINFSPSGGPATAKDDWTFELTGISGRRLLRVAASAAWTIKRITLDGTDVTDTPIEFKGDDVDDIEVLLTQRLTDLSGAITDGRGARITDATVVLFADDRDKWTPLTRYLRSTRPDQDGRYKVRGLPPGRYLAVALDYIEPGEETNPETLDRLRASATRVTLAEGETRALDLKVTTN